MITTKNKGGKYFGEIGQLYGDMLDKLVAESKTAQPREKLVVEKKESFPPKGTFEKAGDGKAKKKKSPFVGKKTGPEHAHGVNPVTKADAKFSMSSEKTETQNINNRMSKNFDKLCADVLSDRLHLENPDIETIDDVTAEPESGAGEPFGGEGHEGEGIDGEHNPELEELSPAELCDKIKELVEVLCSKLEGEELGHEELGHEELEGGEGHEGEELEGSEGHEGAITGETTEMTELKPSAGAKLQSKGAYKVPGHASKVASGKAQTKVTDEVGTEETGIHPLVNPERMNKGLTNTKNNKTAGSVKPGRQIGT